MVGQITNDYISATYKSFVSNDTDGNMIEKNFIEIERTFLLKICYNVFKGINGENVFEHINSFLEVVEPLKVRGLSHDRFRLSVFPISLSSVASEQFTNECISTIATLDDLVERFVQKFYNFFDHDEDDDNPNDIDNEETLIHKARIKISWGDATPGVMKFCTWLKDSFKNFHKLDYDVLVKLKECWWKVSINEICPFTRWDNQLRGPYANAEPNRTFDPYLDNDRISGRNYETNNVKNVQDGKGHMENLTHESSACKIKRFTYGDLAANGINLMLNICGRFGDTWAWVALGPERQPGVAADTPEAAEDALADDEGSARLPYQWESMRGQTTPSPQKHRIQRIAEVEIARTSSNFHAEPCCKRNRLNVDFRTWHGISLETSMMSTMDLDGVTCLTVMSSYTHPSIPSDYDVKYAFSSKNAPNYIPTPPGYSSITPGNISPDSLDDLTKDLLSSLSITFSR
ncbi:hypothetical protein Tco_0799070 [Tanacetum coccineum]